MKIEIKNKSGRVIFEYEKENNTIEDTLLEAVKKGVDLRCADLSNANLRGIDLYIASIIGGNGVNLYGSANLCGANLSGADLRGACLSNVNLSSSDLRGADLSYATLFGTNLNYADLSDAKLYYDALVHSTMVGANLCGTNLCGTNLYVGKIEDWVSFDNIGSSSRTLFFKTDKGVFVQCGGFFGDLEKFVAEVKEKHNGNQYEKEYLSLVEFIKVRFKL